VHKVEVQRFCASLLHQWRFLPVRPPDHDHVVPGHVVLDHARLDDLVRRIRHAAEDPLGRHGPREPAIGIQTREPGVIPPRNPVLHEDHRGFGVEQPFRLLGKRRQQVRF
jgi:hypothetical protein